LELGVDSEQIAQGLYAFRGATRRQDLLGEGYLDNGSRGLDQEDREPQESVMVMDDYAHHPTEIRATLEALRNAYPARRLMAIFQPHLYSRTRDFLEPFAQELSRADTLIVTDIYPAREAPIPGIHASRIVELARQIRPDLEAHHIADRMAIPDALVKEQIVRPGDMCVFLGAGDIREQAEDFHSSLRHLK